MHWNLPATLSIISPDKRGMIDALDPDIARRMRNWVAWKGKGSDSCSSAFMLEYGTGGGGERKARMPVFVAEAERTESSLLAIPDELGSPVALFWLGQLDMSWREIGSQLGIGHETAKARVSRGHIALSAEIYRREAARPDLTIRDARPGSGVVAGPIDRPTHGTVRHLTTTIPPK